MLRYVAAVAVGLLLSLALADSIDPARDANLKRLDSFCLYVYVTGNDPVMNAMGDRLAQELLDKALLYDFPLHAKCDQMSDDLVELNLVTMYDAFSLSLAVFVLSDSDYELPTVWSDTLAANVGASDRRDHVIQVADRAFEELVLAWKKQRQP